MREHLVESGVKYYRWFDTSDTMTLNFGDQSWEDISTQGVVEQSTLSPFGYTDIAHERTRYNLSCSITVPYSGPNTVALIWDWWQTANPTWAMPVVYGSLVDPPPIAYQYVHPSEYIASDGLLLQGMSSVPASDSGVGGFSVLWHVSGDSQSYKGPKEGLAPVPLLWLGLSPASNIYGFTSAAISGGVSWQFSIRTLFSRPVPWD